MNSWGQTFDDLYGLKTIMTEQAWDVTQGNGVTVAVIDTGLDFNHEDIVGNVWTNTGEIDGNGMDDDGNGYIDDIRGFNFVSNNSNVSDDQGHGTHCSGIIAARGNNQ